MKLIDDELRPPKSLDITIAMVAESINITPTALIVAQDWSGNE